METIWVVACVQSKGEFYFEQWIAERGGACYVPKSQYVMRPRHTRQKKMLTVVHPAFPNYAFVRHTLPYSGVPDSTWAVMVAAQGYIRMLSDVNGQPIGLWPSDIEVLMEAEDMGAFDGPEDLMDTDIIIKVGMRVYVAGGAFKDKIGQVIGRVGNNVIIQAMNARLNIPLGFLKAV